MEVFIGTFYFRIDKTVNEAVERSKFLAAMHILTGVHHIIIVVFCVCCRETLVCRHRLLFVVELGWRAVNFQRGSWRRVFK